MDGLILINKPKGMSSHDVVEKVRQLFRVKKVGHIGTLDPVAEGLLLLCLGKATKLTSFLQELDKTYRGRMIFGITTSTLDGEGEIIDQKNASSLTREQVEKVFTKFRGKILQTPPAYSAVHWQGQRLYELARKGIEVKVSPREVEIYQLKLLNFSPGVHPEAEFELRCSKGTYIRSLCRDIGETLGYGAYQSYLCRISIGFFNLSDAKTIEELEKIKEEGKIKEVIYPKSEALSHFPKAVIKRGVEKLVKWGRPLYITHLSKLPADLEKGDKVRICSEDGELLAIAESCQNSSHFVKEKVGFKYLRVLV